MKETSLHFYRELAGACEFDAFFSAPVYSPLPHDWLIVIADIRGSSRSVAAGRYKEVNAIGAAAIVAVVAAIEATSVPYVFGGDGATFAIPAACEEHAIGALALVKDIANSTFDLELRIGVVPVSVIRQAGYDVNIGKYRPTPDYEQAMFSGGGLIYAESLIKQDSPGNVSLSRETTLAPNRDLLSGFECRWDEIPSRHEEVLNLLVLQREPDEAVYTGLLQQIQEIYGTHQHYHPIHEAGMHLATTSAKLDVEARIRSSTRSQLGKAIYRVKLKLLTRLGNFLMWPRLKETHSPWAGYKKRFIENTDFQRFDDMLRLMLAGSREQRKMLINHLESLRKEGKLAYGTSVSSHSLVTCMISDYNRQHVHFVDGRDGGYTIAAEQLKKQLAGTASTNKNGNGG